MKRWIIPLVIAAACMILLAGCECKHQWCEADCNRPRTCTECGLTEGDTLHQWLEPDCENPRKCALCERLDGEPLGHDFMEATCLKPKECKICGQYEGDFAEHQMTQVTCTDPGHCTVCGERGKYVNDHQYSEATCITLPKCAVCGLELGLYGPHDWQLPTLTAPKTCSVCGETNGNVFVPINSFKEENVRPFVGTWVAHWQADGEKWFNMQIDGVDLDFTATVSVTVTDYGLMVWEAQYDEDSFVAAACAVEEERIYQRYMSTYSISREEVPETFQRENGYSIEEFLQEHGQYRLATFENYEFAYYVSDQGDLWAGFLRAYGIRDTMLNGSIGLQDAQSMIIEDSSRGRLEFVKQP